MTQAIQDGTIPRSGNWMADLQAAYRHVKGRGAKPSREKQATAKSGRPAWEATLERVGREVTAR
jgi:hypothetical protein